MFQLFHTWERCLTYYRLGVKYYCSLEEAFEPYKCFPTWFYCWFLFEVVSDLSGLLLWVKKCDRLEDASRFTPWECKFQFLLEEVEEWDHFTYWFEIVGWAHERGRGKDNHFLLGEGSFDHSHCRDEDWKPDVWCFGCIIPWKYVKIISLRKYPQYILDGKRSVGVSLHLYVNHYSSNFPPTRSH